MNFSFKTQLEFNDYFKDEISCYKFLEEQWWDNGIPICPHCGTIKTPYNVKSRSKKQEICYRCSEMECNLPFTIKTGSIFEGTKIELRKWLLAFFEISIQKKGISSIELSEKIGLSQKTCWLMLHKIRSTIKDDNEEKMEGNLQIDETFVGGKNKNRHHDKKIKNSQGRSFIDKTPVLGIIDESEYKIIERQNKLHPFKTVKEKIYQKYSKVKLFVIKDTSAYSIKPILLNNIKRGSTLLTDEWIGYNSIGNYFRHIICDHSKGQYVNENGATTNKVENFWSIFKRGIIGVYQSVSRKHLHLYCNEFATRYNNRGIKVCDKFLFIIDSGFKERVTYTMLTAKI